MAGNATITDRRVSSRGSLREETGNFTDLTSLYTVETKLGRILFFQVGELGGSNDNDGTWYYNAKTAVATEPDPGVIYIVSGLTNGGLYTYRAIGY